MSPPSVGKILQSLWPPARMHNQLDVYALLDAARDEAILPAIQSSDLEFDCLFSGVLPPELMKVAPYLVRLRHSSPFPAWLIEHSWARSWGVFLSATGDRPVVRKHLQRLLLVRDGQGKELYFRYYDPRVLRVYLPTCTSQELQLLFGPVRSYFAEGEDGSTLVQYALRSEQQPVSFHVAVSAHPVT